MRIDIIIYFDTLIVILNIVISKQLLVLSDPCLMMLKHFCASIIVMLNYST